ncbi:baculoviral IAP repeat-containing protein [Endozoicomonas sp.]|uniref:baculoviral IAP repeat-containing protein n=1 Tax=Endozoicomonas sp. TaxID=1892382 RepID=UPI0028883B49|nr:baculoviral IAP repeat-containing protein [Endozoicomonas sp.]
MTTLTFNIPSSVLNNKQEDIPAYSLVNGDSQITGRLAKKNNYWHQFTAETTGKQPLIISCFNGKAIVRKVEPQCSFYIAKNNDHLNQLNPHINCLAERNIFVLTQSTTIQNATTRKTERTYYNSDGNIINEKFPTNQPDIHSSSGISHTKPEIFTISEQSASISEYPSILELACSGFKFTGDSNRDNTTCLTCFTNLCKWEKGDNPVKEHERESTHRPACVTLITQNNTPFSTLGLEVLSGSSYKIKRQSESNSIDSICDDEHYYAASLLIPDDFEMTTLADANICKIINSNGSRIVGEDSPDAKITRPATQVDSEFDTHYNKTKHQQESKYESDNKKPHHGKNQEKQQRGSDRVLLYEGCQLINTKGGIDECGISTCKFAGMIPSDNINSSVKDLYSGNTVHQFSVSYLPENTSSFFLDRCYGLNTCKPLDVSNYLFIKGSKELAPPSTEQIISLLRENILFVTDVTYQQPNINMMPYLCQQSGENIKPLQSTLYKVLTPAEQSFCQPGEYPLIITQESKKMPEISFSDAIKRINPETIEETECSEQPESQVKPFSYDISKIFERLNQCGNDLIKSTETLTVTSKWKSETKLSPASSHQESLKSTGSGKYVPQLTPEMASILSQQPSEKKALLQKAEDLQSTVQKLQTALESLDRELSEFQQQASAKNTNDGEQNNCSELTSVFSSKLAI